jgi:hypothetical protein
MTYVRPDVRNPCSNCIHSPEQESHRFPLLIVTEMIKQNYLPLEVLGSVLGVRNGGSGCSENVPIIAAASYGALAKTIKWLHTHPIEFLWLPQQLS